MKSFRCLQEINMTFDKSCVHVLRDIPKAIDAVSKTSVVAKFVVCGMDTRWLFASRPVTTYLRSKTCIPCRNGKNPAIEENKTAGR